MFPGVGIFGAEEAHSDYVKALQGGDFKVWGICGQDVSTLNKLADSLKIPFVTVKADDLLLHHEVNLVVCMNMTPQLVEFVIKALNVAGKHVICVKNYSLAYSRAVELYDASLKYPSLLSAIENPLRYSTALTEAGCLMDDARIGRVLYCDCDIECGSASPDVSEVTGELIYGGGIMQQFGVLLVDAMLFTLRTKVLQVMCVMRTVLPYPNEGELYRRSDADDYFSFHAKLSRDVLLTINGRVRTENQIRNYYRHEIRIVGSLGRITIYNNRVSLHLFGSSVPAGGVLSTKSQSVEAEYGVCEFPPFGPEYLNMVMDELREIFSDDKFRASKNKARKLLCFYDGLYLRTILDAAIESNKTGCWVTVSPVEEVTRRILPDQLSIVTKIPPCAPKSKKLSKVSSSMHYSFGAKQEKASHSSKKKYAIVG